MSELPGRLVCHLSWSSYLRRHVYFHGFFPALLSTNTGWWCVVLCKYLFPSRNHRWNLKNYLSLDSLLWVATINGHGLCSVVPLVWFPGANVGVMFFLVRNNCLILMALCLYWPFFEKTWVLLPEMPWGWMKPVAFSRAVGNRWMWWLQEHNSNRHLFRSWKESEEFFY